ncbi:MAG: hypothetical protein HY550_02155, partial [Elusimicrobia bacterium]|nr:hypothetical protein [Elusimicrobiota bacterium]
LIYGDLQNKVIGISTRTPAAALDIVSTGTAANVYAQIWRDSTGLIVASMTATGDIAQSGVLTSNGAGNNYFAGSVGIGTSPSVKFHNAGPAILANNTAIDPDTYANSVIAGYITDGGLNITAIGGKASNAGANWAIGHNNIDLIFAAGDATSANTLQTFMQATWKRNLALVPVSGRVGIGLSAATIPDQMLTVAGSISQSGVLISSGIGDNYFAGKVGVGVTAPVSKLQIAGDLGLGDGTLTGNQVVTVWLQNNSGAPRVPGELVVADTSADDGFTTTTVGNDAKVLGIVYEAINTGAIGRVAIHGVVLAKCPSSGGSTRGNNVTASTVAGIAASDTNTNKIGLWLQTVAAGSCSGGSMGRVLLR